MDTNLDKGHIKGKTVATVRPKQGANEDFVLEKSIFSNIFEKDIQKVFIYKKTERLAKAIHLISPAFNDSMSLKNRLDSVAVNLIDAGVVSSMNSRTILARELLTLSSILALGRTTGILSAMNADLISREAQFLLQEVAAYEEPQLSFDDAPSLAQVMKTVSSATSPRSSQRLTPFSAPAKVNSKGHIKDTYTGRRESILAVIKDKQQANIKDISTRVKGVSEKTIQRELQALIGEGLVIKTGDRRWSTYSLA